MTQMKLSVFVLLGLVSLSHGQDKASIARGRDAVRKTTAPLNGSMVAWRNIWKAWGETKKPDDFATQLFDRYGLDSSGDSELPTGLRQLKVLFRPTLGNNCLLCHSSRIAGKTIIGVGNASLDLRSLTEDLASLDPLSSKLPFNVANERGTIEAGASTAILLQARDAELNLRFPRKLHYDDELRHDIPAWWHRRKKKTIFHLGMTDTRSVRANLSFLLAPIFSADDIKGQEPVYRDIRNYLISLEPPKYPFPIDQKLAARGKPVFEANCAQCHGTYGKDGEYPNRIVPLDEIGTDQRLAKSYSPADDEYYIASWLNREVGPDGKRLTGLNLGKGYQAPPLDGVWATAPYFHNASVPTVEHVLDSKSRPQIFTRSFRTDEPDYDKQKLGWKTQPVESEKLDQLTDRARRNVYDTREEGCRNIGHTFGDDLSNRERRQVIEYLKTL